MACRRGGRGWSWLPHGAGFDLFFVVGALEDGVYEDARGVDLVRGELAELDELFYFGDHIIGGGGHHGIEVARCFSVDEIAPTIAFPGLDESEIAAQSAFEDVVAAVEVARFFSFRDHGAVAGRGVESGNARAPRTDALGESALRIPLDLDVAAYDKLPARFFLPD